MGERIRGLSVYVLIHPDHGYPKFDLNGQLDFLQEASSVLVNWRHKTRKVTKRSGVLFSSSEEN